MKSPPDSPEHPPETPFWLRPRPIAHRGLHNESDGVVEHSRIAIQRAIAACLPIEVDIVPSRDHVNFVIHDFDLDRLTDRSGAICSMAASEVSKARLRGHVPEPILTLEELLEMVNAKVPIFLEFKVREPWFGRSVEQAFRTLAGYSGEVAIQSFNPYVLEWTREHFPQYPVGLLLSHVDALSQYREHYLVALLRRQPYDFVGQHISTTNCWTFQHALELGVPIFAYVVRNSTSWAYAKSFASNMYFEYIEPDLSDWRRSSPIDWRKQVGEQADRRFTANEHKGLALPESPPWWFQGSSQGNGVLMRRRTP